MSNDLVDLRSDTVTRPSEGMRKAMYTAEVGDDVFGDDPTVIRLQNVAAERLGFADGARCVGLVRGRDMRRRGAGAAHAVLSLRRCFDYRAVRIFLDDLGASR